MRHSPLQALQALRAQLPGPARIYVAGCSGEPLAIAEAFREEPEHAKDLTFLGIWIPGVNETDWASLHPTAAAESIFVSRDLRSSFSAGRTKFLPLSYVQSYRWLETTDIDAAIVMVTPPDADGNVSLGVSADFSLAPLMRDKVLAIALINPAMPRPKHSPTVPLSRFGIVAEADIPLAGMPTGDLPPAYHQLGAHLAGLIDDGDTIQLGLGNVQQAVLEALIGHKNLRLHAGMISTPLTGLLDAGAMDRNPGAITTGVAIGSADFYTRAASDPSIAYLPVSYTHNISTLSAIPNLKAVNSVIEVDLFGQANAEFIGGRQVSGTGGLVDFLRGAALSHAGMPVTALTSTAKSGTISRIVPRLPSDATSISRADMGIVVTEHGTVDLRTLSIDARAEALISIAAPDYRDGLANAWDDIRRHM